jgi:hypothetical protein
VHDAAGQSLRSMRRHRRSGRLLQRFVGEQPVAAIWQLVDRAPPQQHGFGQRRGPITELLS